MARLILYDTTNYIDYPVGGELTSIRNFLHFLLEKCPGCEKNILLVGLCEDEEKLGIMSSLSLFGKTVPYLPVALSPKDLGNVKSSLRLAFVKGLIKYGKQIEVNKEDLNYIHTPEAYMIAHRFNKKAKCFCFSHGSWMNMVNTVRFFKKQPIVRHLFQQSIFYTLRNVDQVFTLDPESYEDYKKFNKNVKRVKNSIVTKPFTQRTPDEMPKLIFAGRLNKDKRVDGIIRGVLSSPIPCLITIVGDGEERGALHSSFGKEASVRFLGAKTPDETKALMGQSDIFIMNSTHEGIPMAILEALSESLPVISTGVGGIGELLDFGKDSEEIDGSPESIHKAIEKIVGNYSTYAKNAHEKSLQFDYRTVNEEIFEKINPVIEWVK